MGFGMQFQNCNTKANNSQKIPKSSNSASALQKLKAKATGTSVKRHKKSKNQTTTGSGSATSLPATNLPQSGSFAGVGGGTEFNSQGHSYNYQQRSGAYKGDIGFGSAGGAAGNYCAGSNTTNTGDEVVAVVSKTTLSPNSGKISASYQQYNQNNSNHHHTNSANFTNSSFPTNNSLPHIQPSTAMMMKQKTSLSERLNIGDEVRELKIGCTFNSKNTTNAFHTIKYDFKPASVDKNRVATVDVGSNNQVTVTVPNLVSSGVPHTIYKGNQKKYTKECILIFDKRTGEFTLEKLNHNIQVKKTREMTNNKPSVPIPSSMPATALAPALAPAQTQAPAPVQMIVGGKLENSTMRISSKTKVSTGNRRNTIIELKARNSPLQGSPAANLLNNRSPQSAPAWNANNGQATLPSIPMIVDDDDSIFSIGGGGAGPGGGIGGGFNNHANVSASSSSSSSSHHNNSGQEFDFQQLLQSAVSPTKQSKQSHHSNQKRHNNHQRHQQQQQQQLLQQQQLQQQQQQQAQQQLQQTQQQQQVTQWQQHLQQQQQQQQQNQFNRYNGNGNSSTSSSLYSNNHSNNLQNSNHNSNHYQNNYDLASSPTLASEAAALEQNIASDLSSSSSSSESESSGSDSGSDSDDSSDDDIPTKAAAAQMMSNLNQLPSLGMAPSSPQMQYHQQQQNNHNHLSSINNHHQQPTPPSQNLETATTNSSQNSMGNFGFNDGFPNDLLQNDLQLSSNSSDDDSD